MRELGFGFEVKTGSNKTAHAIRQRNDIRLSWEWVGVKAMIGDDQIVKPIVVEVLDDQVSAKLHLRNIVFATKQLRRDVQECSVILHFKHLKLEKLTAGKTKEGRYKFYPAIAIEIGGRGRMRKPATEVGWKICGLCKRDHNNPTKFAVPSGVTS